MRIRWVSPLDPRITEIARYSAQLLPCLERYLGVAAVDDGAGLTEPAWWKPSEAPATPVEGVDSLPIYHIGNNPVHWPIYELSRREPGLVVLHDLSLVDLARHVSRELDQPDWWKQQMVRQYGEKVAGLVHRSENSLADYIEMTSSYPLFLPFVENAIGVVVHSEHSRQAVLNRLPCGSRVIHLGLPAPPPSPPPARDYATRPLEFVFCGHVGPNRRLIEFFEAWGSVPEPGAVKLHLFGNIHNESQLRQHALRCGVSEYLDIHGYVEEGLLEKALQSAHFAINLRWPTMGEASASQLLYWSAALPTLVTDVGWYGELPADAVCKISRSREVADIADLLQDALVSPEKYQLIGRRGWERLEERHSQEDYARQLSAFAREAIDRRLEYRAIDCELVGIIAGMCEDGAPSDLFATAIATAVATLAPVIDKDMEKMT